MTNIRGIILDVDGTLVDSNDQHAKAWCDAFAEKGYRASYKVVRSLIGMGGDRLVPRITGLSEESERGKEVSECRGKLFKAKYLHTIKSWPHSRELLLKMRDAGMNLAVASSAPEDDLGPLLKIAGADDLISGKTSSDDADHSKPDPDIVQAALKKLGLLENEVLMVGDTPYDIEAAGSAGIRTIAFRCGGWDDDNLIGALAIHDNPEELLSHFETSVLSQSHRSTR